MLRTQKMALKSNGSEIGLEELQRYWDGGEEYARTWLYEQVRRGDFFHYSGQDYKLSKRRSHLIDQLLGFRIYPIEYTLRAHAKAQSPTGHAGTWGAVLHQGNQTWVGLDPQTLLTPYSELVEMLQLMELPEAAQVLDLGAAYGRMGLVMHALFPQGHFLGYEYVPERVKEGSRILQKHGCHRARLEERDLTSRELALPLMDVYFIYDFGKVEHIRQILNQIETLAMRHSFYIVARGETTRQMIEYSYPLFKNIYPALHNGAYSIYRV